MKNTLRFLAAGAALALAPLPPLHADIPANQPGLLAREFIYEKAPYPECHASTLVDDGRGGVMAAWFGGVEEKDPSVGIWLAKRRNGSQKWSEGKEVATGVQPDGTRLPCWNPVLWKDARVPGSPVLLFYKVGPSPSTWWGMVKTSDDNGETWSEARKLPEGFLGPIRAKPLFFPPDRLLCPSSTESNDAERRWEIHFELTDPQAKEWQRIAVPRPEGADHTFRTIQPTLLRHAEGRLQFLARSNQGQLAESWSEDEGKTWSAITLSTRPNPDSGADAVTLRDGRHLLISNPTGKGGKRTPLTIATSRDGKEWKEALVLENDPGEYSYPAIIETSDGKVHATYTWKRERIRHVVIDPAQLE